MKRNFGVYLFLIFVVISCNNTIPAIPEATPTPPDIGHWWTSWLDSPACKPPCWQNITPGITTTDEAVSILEKTPGLTITFRSEFGVSWIFNNKEESGNMPQWQDGTVASIQLRNSSEKDLRLESVISSYGIPVYVMLYDCGTGMCSTLLFYPNTGSLVDILLEDIGDVNNFKVNIQPSSIVRGVYFIPSGMDGFNRFPEFQEHQLLKWTGYSTYASPVQ